MNPFPLWLKIATIAGLGISTIAYVIELLRMDRIIESILNKPEKRKRQIITAYRVHFVIDKLLLLLIVTSQLLDTDFRGAIPT